MKAVRTRYQRGKLAVAIAEKIRRESGESDIADLAESLVIVLAAPMEIMKGRVARDSNLQRILENIPE
jgi:hypothetical protein